MVSLYLGNTYKLRGGGSSGVSTSGAVHGAVLGRAPPHPLVSPADFASPAGFASPADFATVASVSLQRKPYQCIHHTSVFTIPVYSHLGTHAMSAVDSPKLRIVTITYECSETSPGTLPLMALYVTCSLTTDSSREPLKIERKK